MLRRKDRRRWIANFVGRIDTHPIRKELESALSNRSDVYFSSSPRSPRKYASILMSSQVTLAPRGYGGSSFRFWEAIKSGSIPWLIGEIDNRPFKSSIDWDRCSFWSRDVREFEVTFESLSQYDLDARGRYLVESVAPLFRFGNWCQLLIDDLAHVE